MNGNRPMGEEIPFAAKNAMRAPLPSRVELTQPPSLSFSLSRSFALSLSLSLSYSLIRVNTRDSLLLSNSDFKLNISPRALSPSLTDAHLIFEHNLWGKSQRCWFPLSLSLSNFLTLSLPPTLSLFLSLSLPLSLSLSLPGI